MEHCLQEARKTHPQATSLLVLALDSAKRSLEEYRMGATGIGKSRPEIPRRAGTWEVRMGPPKRPPTLPEMHEETDIGDNAAAPMRQLYPMEDMHHVGTLRAVICLAAGRPTCRKREHVTVEEVLRMSRAHAYPVDGKNGKDLDYFLALLRETGLPWTREGDRILLGTTQAGGTVNTDTEEAGKKFRREARKWATHFGE